MFCLISPNEPIYNPYTGEQVGVRIAEVNSNQFEVASPLFWLECPEYLTSDNLSDFYYAGEAICDLTLIENPRLIPVTEI